MGKLNITIRKTKFTVFWVVAVLLLTSAAFSQKTSGKVKNRLGKRPVIIIPGIMGSELKDSDNGETVWFSILKSDGEDLRLPIALNLKLSTDKLVPGDIIRKIKLKFFPDVKIYKGIIDSLIKNGYEEAKWEDPPKDLEGKFFVFPYDWRRDNVETAQFLIEEIKEVKRLTGRRDAKFNVLAHSMGGLVARYAAMYGMADLPRGRPRPNWAGAKHFANLFFFGTPNEGSAEALQTLFKGQSSLGGTVKLPFVRYLTPMDIATMPAVFQLLPHSRTTRFYDENLRPLKIDLYNIKNWKKYGWAIYAGKKHLKNFSEAEKFRFEKYFDLVLKRAKRFHRALDIASTRKNPIGMHLIGSDCKKTLDAMVLYKNDRDKWVTLTKPSSFKTSKGRKVSSRALKSLMLIPGDGSVTRRSLLAEMLKKGNKKKVLFGSDSKSTTLFVCEVHDQIMNNSKIQRSVISALIADRGRRLAVKP